MRTLLALSIAAASLAHAQRPPGFVRGEVTENTALSFAVRTSAGDIYRYRADARTWIERDHDRIRAASLNPGEILEVVSDRDPDPVRYARMVHVIQPVRARPLPVSSGGVYRLKPAAANPTSVYAGYIVAHDNDRVVLRTRIDGDKIIDLQTDTRFLHNGDQVNATTLVPLTRVSILVVPGMNRELIASQIIWGDLLRPDQP